VTFMNSRPRTPRTPKTALEFIKAAPVLSIHELQATRTPGIFPEFVTHCKTSINYELQELQELPLRGKEPWSSSPSGVGPGWKRKMYLEIGGVPDASWWSTHNTAGWTTEDGGHFDFTPNPWVGRPLDLERRDSTSLALAGLAMGVEDTGPIDADGRSKTLIEPFLLIDQVSHVEIATNDYQQSFCVLFNASCLNVNSGRTSRKGSMVYAVNLAHSRSIKNYPQGLVVREAQDPAAICETHTPEEIVMVSRCRAMNHSDSVRFQRRIPLCFPLSRTFWNGNACKSKPFTFRTPMQDESRSKGGAPRGVGGLFRLPTQLCGTSTHTPPKNFYIFR